MFSFRNLISGIRQRHPVSYMATPPRPFSVNVPVRVNSRKSDTISNFFVFKKHKNSRQSVQRQILLDADPFYYFLHIGNLCFQICLQLCDLLSSFKQMPCKAFRRRFFHGGFRKPVFVLLNCKIVVSHLNSFLPFFVFAGSILSFVQTIAHHEGNRNSFGDSICTQNYSFAQQQSFHISYIDSTNSFVRCVCGISRGREENYSRCRLCQSSFPFSITKLIFAYFLDCCLDFCSALTLFHPDHNGGRHRECTIHRPPQMQAVWHIVYVLTLGRMILHNDFVLFEKHIFKLTHIVPRGCVGAFERTYTDVFPTASVAPNNRGKSLSASK
nr:MAG TPA: hypothetical protein [Caudoviricetes sp.]